VGAQLACVYRDADPQLPDPSWLSSSSQAACIHVSTHYHIAHSPDKALSRTLCLPAHSPVIIYLHRISQKASYFHFQLRDQSQVFGGETRTHVFPSSFPVISGWTCKALSSPGGGEEQDSIPTEVPLARWHPDLLSPEAQGQVCVVASGALSTVSLVQLKNTGVPTRPMDPCAASMVNAMQ